MTELGINTEYELRVIESKLELVGQSICDANGGCESWNEINRSLEHLRNAIRACWKIED